MKKKIPTIKSDTLAVFYLVECTWVCLDIGQRAVAGG